jgi:Na+-transporting NADH:ubiquinone oxidoreductase subunit A
MLRERPFGTIANPDHKPKGIYVSMRDTNPLAPDIDFALKGREHEFAAGVEALSAFAEVHCVKAEGPHPAGNIGTIVAALNPINKGECIWSVGAQDVANIGRWCLTGEYRPERVVAVGGPAAKAPKYYRMLCGACLKRISEVQLIDSNYPSLSTLHAPLSTRIISGSVLSGTAVEADGFLGMYDQQVTFIEEGDRYDFMGWLMPGLKKFSFSKTFLSGFVRLLPTAHYPLPTEFNTNMHGSVRPFLFTGSFEQVFPFDIYPLQLIKACIVGDVELQEKLGIYEVEPEDFALCEFIDPSKTEIQTIIREALEVLRKEATE